VKVLHIPGHTPGSISLLDVRHRSLIGGDPIQEDGGIFMFGPYRDMEAYVLGLEHVWEFEAEYDSIYPSHAKMPVNKNIIPKLIEGAKAILAGNVEGVPGEMHGHPILTYDIGVSRFFCDRQTSDQAW
jgi:glyoxylase-like metal-dependent hydrolase (beta-lactamase superfamily II)